MAASFSQWLVPRPWFRLFFALILLGGLWPSGAGAAVIAYWNMDADTLDGKLSANAGSQAGSVTGTLEELAVGFFSRISPNVSGTTLNVIGTPGSPNRGVGFYRVGTFYEAGAFVMSGFDFTGLSGVVVSFAYLSEESFTWDENLHVDYRINSGSWVDIEELETWSAGYSLASVSFGSLLDNTAAVDLRIRTQNWVSTFGHLDIDNVQVTAIPEPTSAVLLGAGLVLAVARRLAARRSKHACALSPLA